MSASAMINAVVVKRINDIKRQSFDLPTHWVQDWLLHILDKPHTFLISHSDYKLTNDELQAFELGIQRMQAGEPLAYLIGKQSFWSLEFLVNEHTLIPRPDTEVLVEQVLSWITVRYDANSLASFFEDSLSNKNNHQSPHKKNHENSQTQSPPIFKLLDLGTGSGCIAISLAHELQQLATTKEKKHGKSQWQVTAVDYSTGAIAIAKKNAVLSEVTNVDIIQSDWFSALPLEDKYAVIVSNPPYIDNQDSHLSNLMAEPLTALVADNNGLADIEHIVKNSAEYLVPDGLLAIEHGYNQGRAVRQLFEQYGFYKVKTIKDYGNNDRVTLGQLYTQH